MGPCRLACCQSHILCCYTTHAYYSSLCRWTSWMKETNAHWFYHVGNAFSLRNSCCSSLSHHFLHLREAIAAFLFLAAPLFPLLFVFHLCFMSTSSLKLLARISICCILPAFTFIAAAFHFIFINPYYGSQAITRGFAISTEEGLIPLAEWTCEVYKGLFPV